MLFCQYAKGERIVYAKNIEGFGQPGWSNMSRKSDINTEQIKEDDSVTALAQYLEVNREKAYSFATANTKYDEYGHPTISEEDEWVGESEWDDLFDLLKITKQMEK